MSWLPASTMQEVKFGVEDLRATWAPPSRQRGNEGDRARARAYKYEKVDALPIGRFQPAFEAYSRKLKLFHIYINTYTCT